MTNQGSGIGDQGPAKNIRALAKVFFGRLFENDLFSSAAAATANVAWLLALTATPGVMFSASQVFLWAGLRAMAERLNDPMMVDSALLRAQSFHIDFVMGVSGLVTMMVWGSLTPDRRDAFVLGPLPVTAREQAQGRLLGLLKFFGMFIGAVAVPTALAFNFVSVGPGNLMAFPGRVVGHIVAATLAGGSIFFLLVTIQLALAALFGPRAIRFITLPLQLLALAGMIAALISSASLVKPMLEQGLAAGPIVLWNPAAWFAGVYRWIGGDSREVFVVLAMRGLLFGAAIIASALVLYPLAYERCLRNVIASEGRTTGAVQRGWATLAARLLRPVLRAPLQRSLAAFMLATLGRSHTHRFVIGTYAAIAFLTALPVAGRFLQVQATADDVRYAWFALSLGAIFWLVCGVRYSLMLPVEPIANWAFRITEPVDKRRMLTTVVTVLAFVTCVPVAGVAAASAVAMDDRDLAIALLAIVPLAGLCLIELLTLTMKTVPFSCTYLPGQLRLRVFWPLYFLLWLTFVFRTSRWGLWATGDTTRTLQVAAFFLVLWVVLRVWHLVRARKIQAFVYDEHEDALVTTMDIATSMKQL